jgi:hypothetical protein
MRLHFFPLLFLLATAAHAQPADVLMGTDRFHHAFYDEYKNEVTFEPFQEVDWEANARATLTWLNLDRPTPEQIARLSHNEIDSREGRFIHYQGPLAPAVGRSTYLLIYATGIVPLQPVQLNGSVDFDFDESMTAVKERYFSGVVVAKPLRPVTSAAFAVMGKPADVKDVDPQAKFERRKQAGSAVYDFTDAGRAITWVTSSKDCSGKAASEYECLDAESALSFRLSGQHLLLVKWKGAACDQAYALFSVDTALKPIAGNEYGCE